MSVEGLGAVKLALAGRSLWQQEGTLRNAEPIAVVGMALRFPNGIDTPEKLWEVLLGGDDQVREVPADRWDLDEWYDADPATPGKISTRWGGFLEDIRGFDADFFDISAREAERMDPQQRVALEVACEAVERAGIPLTELRGTNIGVYFSSYHSDYTFLQYRDLESVSGRTLTGTLHSVIPNRISYALGLRGPSMTIDSACSSSLVGCHLASQALRSRDCDTAIVGGVNLMITPDVTVALSKGGFMSPTGHCWTFDANADGFVRSEGCAVVVLKRLSDAIAAGDPVLGVIRGSAVNQDGTPTTLSAPNGLAQTELVRSALRNAGLTPNDISVLEAHGTGTELGDPIETDALGEVYAERDPALGPCWLGSLKSNFGHMEAAAGLAGLIKSLLVLRHGVVPPHAMFTAANPHLNLDERVFAIAREATALPVGVPRRAGISGFGVGGTNAHLIVEETPAAIAAAAPAPVAGPYLLPLSARSENSVRQLASRYAARLREGADAGLLSRAAARRRAHFKEYRAAVVAPNSEGLIAELEAIAGGLRPTAVPAQAPLAFVFSGQGTQWPGMALGLRDADPAFAAELTRVNEAFAAAGGIRPLEELERTGDDSRLERTDVAQAAMFAVQVALLRVLDQRGIKPSVVIGHSVGELAAAHAAGLLSLEDAVQAVLDRGAAMQAEFDSGRMIAVRVSEDEAASFIAASGLQLTVSAINGPRAVVLSGPPEAVADAQRRLELDGVRHSVLDVRFGFHSELMDSAAAQLRGIARQPEPAEESIPFISTVTGREQGGFDYRYLADNVRSPVRFAAAVDEALDQGIRHFIEIGPHPALGNAIVEIAEARGLEAEIAFTQHRERDPVEALQLVTGRAYQWGNDPDWNSVYAGRCVPVDLPTYPWNHKPYWLPEAQASQRQGPSRTPFPGRAIRSPLLDRTLFEIEAGDAVFAAFADHRVGGEPRLPATALLELIRTAAVEAGNTGAVVRNVGIVGAVEPAALRQLQVTVDAGGDGRAEVFIETATGDWVTVATADVERGEAVDRASLPPMSDSAAAVEVTGIYEGLEQAGLQFGEEFRLLQSGSATATSGWGTIALDRAPEWQGKVNPAVVDAASHLCIAVLEAADSELHGRALLPSTVDEYRLIRSGELPQRAAVTLRSTDRHSVSFDVFLLDEAGEPLLCLFGWTLRVAATAPLRQPTWEAQLVGPRTRVEGRWLLIPDADEELAAAVSERLVALGHEVEQLPLDRSILEPRLVDGALSGLIHLAALDDASAASDGNAALERAAELVAPLLSAARLDEDHRGEPLRLILVTRGAQLTGSEATTGAPVGAAAIGMMRALRAEAPHITCLAIDLPHRSAKQGADAAELIVAETLSSDAGEVTYRDGIRLVHRSAPADMKAIPAGHEGVVELVHDRPGTLDGFSLRAAEAAPLPAGHVRISVLAAGVNFRDVLIALGSYPGEAAMGMECCGLVTEVGAEVEGFAPGDRVLVFAPGSFANEMVAPAAFVSHAPRNLTPAEAATLPVAYGTAWYALFELGRLRPGGSVLVHAGAGGVGQAAIHLALRHGATVYATAGSPEKRQHLLEMGVAGAFDSRSTSFADDLLDATQGAGVSVVINSLVGELIPAGLSCLEPGGVFVELGKRELLNSEHVRSFRDDIQYHAFDLREVAQVDPTLLPRIYGALREAVEEGDLPPLPLTSTPLAEAENAFRLMARAQHTGKLVLVPPPAPPRPYGWTVITGGTGGMGESTLRWVLQSGARNVAIWSRRGATPEFEARLDAMRDEFAARIVTQAVDVADTQQVEDALSLLRAGGLPITGVVHAAGVLDDATLRNVSPEQLRAVLMPKVSGAWNLHRATLSDPVNQFVLYSAIGSLIDAAGQGAYSAGNAFLDALACRRREAGLPAIAIRWGLFSGGMATTLDAAQQERWSRKGLDWLDGESGGQAFAAALRTDAPHLLAVRLSAPAAARGNPTSAPAARAGLSLEGLSTEEATRMVLEHVQSAVTTMLGLAAPADVEAPLRDIGLDSLSAIELRNALTVSSGVSLPATLAFDHPTVSAIASYLLRKLGRSERAAGDPSTPLRQSRSVAQDDNRAVAGRSAAQDDNRAAAGRSAAQDDNRTVAGRSAAQDDRHGPALRQLRQDEAQGTSDHLTVTPADEIDSLSDEEAEAELLAELELLRAELP